MNRFLWILIQLGKFLDYQQAKLRKQQMLLALIVSIVLFVAGVWGIIYSFVLESRTQKIQREGLHANAVVTQKERKLCEDKEHIYYIHYMTFFLTTDTGERIDKRSDVSEKLYDSAEEGHTIPVIYLKENPEQLLIEGESDGHSTHLMGGLICLPLSIFIFCMAFPWEVWRNRRKAAS